MYEEELTSLSFGELVKTFRMRKGINQSSLANLLGVHRNAISAWEQGDRLPRVRGMILELASYLRLSEDETHLLLDAGLSSTKRNLIWSIPYPRNPFFTGRERILHQLNTILCPKQKTDTLQSLVLYGLPGIGKTSIAVEYAYRYASVYTALLWIDAGSDVSFTSSLNAVTKQLGISDDVSYTKEQRVADIVSWLCQHQGWLIIIDDVRDSDLIKPFFVSLQPGALLLTTRLFLVDSVPHMVRVPTLPLDESLILLLRRSKLIKLSDTLEQAASTEAQAGSKIVEILDGLPLAVDQVGAYAELAQCALSSLLPSLQENVLHFLKEPFESGGHPYTLVQEVINIFLKVQQRSSLIADLLMFCAFLGNADIPQMLLVEYVQQKDSYLRTDSIDSPHLVNVMKDLYACTLISRNRDTQTCNMHRLVQLILRMQGPEKLCQQALRDAIAVLNRTFPLCPLSQEQMLWCEQLLPHVLACISYAIRNHAETLDMAALCTKLVQYLQKKDAEELAKEQYAEVVTFAKLHSVIN